jgi:hypothetical protein
MSSNDQKSGRVETPKVYVKIHRFNGEVLVAVCDEDVLGVLISDPVRKTRLYIDPVFYKGDLVSIDRALEVLKTSTQANLVGSNIVDAAIRAGLVDPGAVLSVGNVKIAIYVRL